MNYIKAIFVFFSLMMSIGLSTMEAKPKLIFGTHSHPTADGQGCEGDHGICVIISGRLVDDNFDIKDLGDNMALAEIEIIDGELKMNILYDNSKNCFEKEFHVVRDITFDEEICAALGYRSVIIESGDYGVDFSRFEYGTVVLNAKLK